MKHRQYMAGIVLLLLLGMIFSACSQPQKPAEDETTAVDYGFTLTSEQAQNYQSAVSYLLKREGEDLYRVQYSNCGVTLVDGKLSTNFNGMAIAVFCPAGERCYPVLDLNGIQGDALSCIGSTFLTSMGEQAETTCWRYLLQVDENKNKPELVAMRQYDNGTDEQMLSGKYRDLPDFSAYSEAFFHDGTYYHPTYGDDGDLLPLNEWEEDSWFTGYSFAVDNELEMEYVPLVGGDYYLLYEVTDTQGNVYCSELIPYKTEKEAPEEEEEPDIQVKWTKGERQQLLLEQNGVELYLSVEKDISGDSIYALKVKNNSSNAVFCSATGGLVNGNVTCSAETHMTVESGKFVADSFGFYLGVADGSTELEEIRSLQFTVYVKDSVSGKTVIEEQTIQMDMTEAWPVDKKYAEYFKMSEPAMDAMAQEQILLDDGAVRLTLIGAGHIDSFWSNDLTMTYKLENLSQRKQSVKIRGVVINGVFNATYCSETLPSGCINYMSHNVSEYGLKDTIGNSIESLAILVETQGQEDWLVPSVQRYWIPVTLTEAGTAAPFEKGTLLWEDSGIQIGIRGFNEISNSWTLTLTNNSEQAVSLAVIDAATGEKLRIEIRAGAGQNACFKVEAPAGFDGSKGFAVRFRLCDFDGDTIVAEGTEDFILEAT